MSIPILSDIDAQPNTGVLTNAIASLFENRTVGVLDAVIRSHMLRAAEMVDQTEVSISSVSTLVGYINEFHETDGFADAAPYHNILKAGLIKELETLLLTLPEAGAL